MSKIHDFSIVVKFELKTKKNKLPLPL